MRAALVVLVLAAIGCACDPTNPCPAGRYDPGPPTRRCVLDDGGIILLDDAGPMVDASVVDAGPCLDGEMRACGSDVGECIAGMQQCSEGAWGPCLGEGVSATERCNTLDDDCDGSTDEETSAMCGALPGAVTVACIEGACRAASCDVGLADCDDDASTGCETDTRTSDLHCGACDSPCAWGCDAGTCADPVALAGYGRNLCAVRADGRVVCLGDNASGELGDGTMSRSDRFVRVQRVTGAEQVAVGDDFACALVAGGRVSCWGANETGQLGDGTTMSRPLASGVEQGALVFTAITAGSGHVCARTASGMAYCWGDNGAGQVGVAVGNPFLRTPTQVAGLADVVSLAAGSSHSCATTVEGAFCWGSNRFGELGDPLAEGGPPLVAVPVAAAAGIWGGRNSTCARSDAPTPSLLCFGQQVSPDPDACASDGTTADVPVPVALPMEVAAVTSLRVGEWCALLGDRSVSCWAFRPWGSFECDVLGSRYAPLTITALAGATAIAPRDAGPCAIIPGRGVVCGAVPDGPFTALPPPAP